MDQKFAQLKELNEQMKNGSNGLWKQYYDLHDEVVNELFINKFPEHFDEQTRFECPLGWFDLFGNALAELNALTKEIGVSFVFTQVKEKFGSMRIYMKYSHSWDTHKAEYEKLMDVVSKYESAASKVCTVCGEPGEMYTEGWIRPACKKHWPKK